jgi:DNA-binding NtrC family response regulator
MRVLLVEDSSDFLNKVRGVFKTFNKEGFDLETAETLKAAKDAVEKQEPGLVLLDLQLPEDEQARDCDELNDHAGWEFIDFLEKKNIAPRILVVSGTLDDEAVRRLRQNQVEDLLPKATPEGLLWEKIRFHAMRALHNWKAQNVLRKADSDYIAESQAMQKIQGQIQRYAKHSVTVRIQGETGVGKDVVAHRIHDLSPRCEAPFIVVDCGSIPQEMAESQLFGHVRGAFTGAVCKQPGSFQAAHGGTLFLDEIQNLSLEVQQKLLRALQEREVTPLGSTKAVSIDVRVIAAGNKNLWKEVEERRFREDLYYRLNVIEIEIPPLRERKEDILPLAQLFLAKYCREYKRSPMGLSPEAETWLQEHPWPGNIRMLENTIQRAIIHCDAEVVGVEHLDKEGVKKACVPQPEDLEDIWKLPWKQAEPALYLQYRRRGLERCKGDRNLYEREAGISINHNLKKAGLKVED